METFVEDFQTFTTIFLGIFIEAAPFLLLGTLTSGLLEVFVSREDILRLVPRSLIPATLMGGLMGLAFPVCECGVVPVTRRLYRKGFPVSAGIAFLLAAPIINPVTLASTYAAFGFGDVLILRFALGLTIPMIIGLIFAFGANPARILLPQSMAVATGGSGLDVVDSIKIKKPKEPLTIQIRKATRIASDEFFEMAQYLIMGAILAALMQTYVSRDDILSVASGPVSSVFMLQVLGFVLSVCSTVDAFIARALPVGFTTGSLLSFLVFGPMVDIKSTLMFLKVFRQNVVFYLIALPFLLVMLATVFINLNVGL